MADPTDVDALEIEGVWYSPQRGLELRMRHPVFAALLSEIVSLFDENGATNYLAMDFYTEEHGPMSVVIQKQSGESPATRADRLQERVEALEEEVSVLREIGGER